MILCCQRFGVCASPGCRTFRQRTRAHTRVRRFGLLSSLSLTIRLSFYIPAIAYNRLEFGLEILAFMSSTVWQIQRIFWFYSNGCAPLALHTSKCWIQFHEQKCAVGIGGGECCGWSIPLRVRVNMCPCDGKLGIRVWIPRVRFVAFLPCHAECVYLLLEAKFVEIFFFLILCYSSLSRRLSFACLCSPCTSIFSGVWLSSSSSSNGARWIFH